MIGAGVSGLGCTLRLAARGYDVAVYEQSARIGGHLHGVLPPGWFLPEFERQFQHMRYELHLKTRIARLDDLDAEAVYVATGAGVDNFGLVADPGGAFATTTPGVFIGGSVTGSDTMSALADGLAASGAVERYLKAGTMNHPRGLDTTRLVLDKGRIVPAVEVIPADGRGYTGEEASAESGRCLRCTCDACMRVCDLMSYFKKTPRRIAEEVQLTVHPGTLDGNGTLATRLISTCTQCGLCREVCPVCLQRIPAARVQSGEEVYLRKTCAAHGEFSSIIWRGRMDFGDRIAGAETHADGNPACPTACGLCAAHLQSTCCVLLEVSYRCNLSCRYCFAKHRSTADPPLEQVDAWLRQLADPGKTLVQLSGGEPTLRDDLPAVVAAAKAAGCRHVQLNSNGVRLAADARYARALADAGLSFVFTQFDGTRDSIHEALRGRPLADINQQAIGNCADARIGVTLVPTHVPGVNSDDIGAILRFAIDRAPAVRGFIFSP